MEIDIRIFADAVPEITWCESVRAKEREREGERERERIRKDVRERVIGSLFHVGNQHSTWTLFSPVGHEFDTLVLQRRQHGIVIL